MLQDQRTQDIDLMRSAFAALNARELDRCQSMLTPDFIINLLGMPTAQHGRDSWRLNVDGMFRSFPDLQADVEDIFGSDGKVAVRVTFHGTHEAEFLGLPATHRRVRYQSLELYRIADGKIAEEWIASDVASLMTQISTESQD